jgi:hypothetical protein
LSFEQQQNVTITGFEDVWISLFVPGVSNVESVQSGRIEIQLALSDGKIRLANYDLLARLQDDPAGQTHATNLLAMRDYILARIETEVLP